VVLTVSGAWLPMAIISTTTCIAFTQIWGDGSNGSYTVILNNPENGRNNLHTIYGRIPLSSQRAAHVGIYSDTIIVTVSY